MIITICAHTHVRALCYKTKKMLIMYRLSWNPTEVVYDWSHTHTNTNLVELQTHTNISVLGERSGSVKWHRTLSHTWHCSLEVGQAVFAKCLVFILMCMETRWVEPPKAGQSRTVAVKHRQLQQSTQKPGYIPWNDIDFFSAKFILVRLNTFLKIHYQRLFFFKLQDSFSNYIRWLN